MLRFWPGLYIMNIYDFMDLFPNYLPVKVREAAFASGRGVRDHGGYTLGLNLSTIELFFLLFLPIFTGAV